MIRLVTVAIGLVCVGAAQSATAGASAGAYLGAGCTGKAQVSRFSGLLGRRPASVTDFADNSSWTNMIGSANWSANCWRGYRMVESVPMLAGSVGTLADGAAGSFDQQFIALGNTLVADKQPYTLLRIGWEFNGNWYRWNAAQDPASFVAYYRRIVADLRSVPGQHFKFIWNPALGQQSIAADTVYPGDDVVDMIGMDVYNQSWRPQDDDPATRWRGLLTQSYGLNWLADFARQHRRSIALPEWGTGIRPDGHGGGDDPLFITNMAAWIRTHQVAFQNYWDYNAPDYNGTLSDGSQPLSAAAYAAAFGTPPVPVPQALASAAAVPEPAAWLLQIIGFGLVGTRARRRRFSR